MQPATCLPNYCFCEKITSGAIAQPANAWSSLSFVVVGLLIVCLAVKDKKGGTNPLTTIWVYGVLYGFILSIIGVGSFYYHSKLNFVGQFIDVLGMYLLATAILFYRYFTATKTKAAWAVSSYILFNMFFSYILYTFPNARRYIFAFLIIAILGLEYRLKKQLNLLINRKFLYVAVAILSIAFIIWVLDITKIFCSPTSLFQGHALWHILGALSSSLIYLYYRSEQINPTLSNPTLEKQ